MIFKDQLNFVQAPPFTNDRLAFRDVFLTITGAGTVSIEFLEEDGVWRSFPETTFTGSGAHIVVVKRGDWRIRIAAASATTVEIRP